MSPIQLGQMAINRQSMPEHPSPETFSGDAVNSQHSFEVGKILYSYYSWQKQRLVGWGAAMERMLQQ